MKNRIPFFSFLVCVLIGILFGLIDRNYAAGILLGVGVGLILMVLLRFILPKKKIQEEISSGEQQSN